MQYCSQCGVQLPYGTRICPSCNHPTTVPNAQPFIDSTVKKLLIVISILATVSFLIVMVVLVSISKNLSKSQLASLAPTATPPPPPTPTPPPPDALSLAKDASREGADKESLGEAMTLLRSIPKEAKEYKQAQALLDTVTKRWARLAAEEIVLGPKPQNSGWDGSVHCVDRYLKNTLNDYDSAEYMEWSPVTKIEVKGEPFWAVRLKLRAKNAFGGKIIKNVVFYIRQNQVVSHVGL